MNHACFRRGHKDSTPGSLVHCYIAQNCDGVNYGDNTPGHKDSSTPEKKTVWQLSIPSEKMTRWNLVHCYIAQNCDGLNYGDNYSFVQNNHVQIAASWIYSWINCGNNSVGSTTGVQCGQMWFNVRYWIHFLTIKKFTGQKMNECTNDDMESKVSGIVWTFCTDFHSKTNCT